VSESEEERKSGRKGRAPGVAGFERETAGKEATRGKLERLGKRRERKRVEEGGGRMTPSSWPDGKQWKQARGAGRCEPDGGERRGKKKKRAKHLSQATSGCILSNESSLR